MYTIVKYAGDDKWEHYFDTDPKKGVRISHSAFYTYSGSSAGIKLSYESAEEANADLKKINGDNPCGDYAVCIVISDD